MRFPLDNWSNVKKGYRFGEKTFYNDFHVGLDLIVPTGTPIYAPFAGQVTQIPASDAPDGGNTTHLSNRRFFLRFLHQSKFIAGHGQIQEGGKLGLVGSTGKSTGPHTHTDISYSTLQLNNKNNFINPEDFFVNIKVLVVGEGTYDLVDVTIDNPFIQITQKIKKLEPKWVMKDNGEMEIDENWFDMNVWESGYDIIAFVTKDYKRLDTRGYAEREQRLGAYRCVVSDTGKPRGNGKGWRRTNQVAGTLEHEIYHALHYGSRENDRTHEYDKGEGFPVIRLSRFKGFEIADRVRLFKKSTFRNKVLERIVPTKLYLSMPQLWTRFGFKKTL